MTSRIKGASPPKPGPATNIVRVTTETRQKHIILSASIFGTWIHWYGNRSHECCLDKGDCEKCRRGWPRKWKGYLHTIDCTSGLRVFVELTPTAVKYLEHQAPPEEPYRGLEIFISKTKGGPKGRYIIDVQAIRRDPAQLPSEEDPLPVLQYLWNCKNPTGDFQTK